MIPSTPTACVIGTGKTAVAAIAKINMISVEVKSVGIDTVGAIGIRGVDVAGTRRVGATCVEGVDVVEIQQTDGADEAIVADVREANMAGVGDASMVCARKTGSVDLRCCAVEIEE